MTTRVLLRERPSRSIALLTESHALIFRHVKSSNDAGSTTSLPSTLAGPTGSTAGATPKCIVELVSAEKVDLDEYRTVSYSVFGTLGLITVDNDVFICVVSGAKQVAVVRPGETIQRILSVDFQCLSRPDYDRILNEDINAYPTDSLDEDGYEMSPAHQRAIRDAALEHPCLALKKLLSGGSFYFSSDFDVTRRLQDRAAEDASTFDFDSFDKGYLWNSYMIKPLIDFRTRLSGSDRRALDSTGLLTSAIRGFALTRSVPGPSAPSRQQRAGVPSTLTLISRLSCKRAGTRFNARGVDDDGNVANFVETETIFWSPTGLCYSYVQIRGSIPVFWEQSAGLVPGQQKVQITRSLQATQPAFDKHFEELEVKYGNVHIVNLLSKEKTTETELSERYRNHIARCSLNNRDPRSSQASSEHRFLKVTEYDFHAQTRGSGYEAASAIKYYIQDSAESFGYCLSEVVDDVPVSEQEQISSAFLNRRFVTILQQQGIFRVNCLDCLDRTNLIQTNISQLTLEMFLEHRGEQRVNSEFLARHGSLWADNGDALSRIYAGTGALKSSFTRHGKMSIAGALADVRKSAQRMYVNNFTDKDRQITMDMLLGRLMGQSPVYLFDPINEFVNTELSRRASEYSMSNEVAIWAGTFNLNGRTHGINSDLSPWLFPHGVSPQHPDIVAVGFQEIVELIPQRALSTDPAPRQAWERAVKKTLNAHAHNHGLEEYVLLRGNQLVGASLSIFVRTSMLQRIKNVEGSLKKTGFNEMAGNKGAVAIRMEINNTSLCFVTAHLAAGFANYDERNRDYRTISHGLRFQRNRSIEDHDSVIWLGDFNYRIGLSDEPVRRLIAAEDYETLYENDQLNLQMVAGLTFPYYSEARILFKPTYKYDVGTDTYDTSEKARIPAWCDRILRKGNNLRQRSYNVAPELKFSDHRPVYATFVCSVSVIDEVVRERMSHEIYEARRAQFGSHSHSQSSAARGNDGIAASDDEDLLGYESGGPATKRDGGIEPELPPASSDKRKWWLDNGMPSRSNVMPPHDRAVPNPNRASNPFSQSAQPDWVTPQRSASLASRNVSGASNGLPALPPRRPMPASSMPPLQPLPLAQSIEPSTPMPTRPTAPAAAAADAGLTRVSSNASSSGRRPVPPPVPKKKPTLQGSPTSSGSVPTVDPLTLEATGTPPPLPLPRRTTQKPQQGARASAKTAAVDLLGDDDEGMRPPPSLPGRTKSPLDDDDDDEADGNGAGAGGAGLSTWVPLKPS